MLKSCPFCGGEVVANISRRYGYPIDVHCTGCDTGFKLGREVEKKWNRRIDRSLLELIAFGSLVRYRPPDDGSIHQCRFCLALRHGIEDVQHRPNCPTVTAQRLLEEMEV